MLEGGGYFSRQTLICSYSQTNAQQVSFGSVIAMSRLAKGIKVCDEESSCTRSHRAQGSGGNSGDLDHDIAQLTKLRSKPNEHLRKATLGGLKMPVSTLRMLAARESNYSGRGRFSLSDSCHVLSRYLPICGPQKVDKMGSRAYVSQFSADGSLFVAGFQGSHIRIYNVDKGWEVKKNILAKSLRWTITDTCLSPDQRYLVYSSMSPLVHIVNIESAATESLANVTEIHDGLDFSTDNNDEHEGFSIFSVKFSTDGRELVAASSDGAIYIYDLVANKVGLQIPAHEVDVNTVCFADESGHIIYSGSDDHFCKVWDRRCPSTTGQAAGVLTGHLEGITFIDSRGDGRYLISNGKDQSTKLWDIRKMTSNSPTFHRRRDFIWDYRWMEYPVEDRNLKHPHDQSVATYKGHSVLYTLIRCYFSPAYSTGQKYIYTGSSDCIVYIYDLVSGNQVAKLNHHDKPVRDCSWHPFYPLMVTSSWDGVIAKWEFPGDGKTTSSSRPRQRRSRRAMFY